MIIESLEQTDSMDIFLRFRDENGEVMEKIVEGVEPYFYVRKEDIGDILQRFETSGLEYGVADETGGYWAFDSNNPDKPIALMQITCNKISDVRRLRDLAMESWEADVDFKDRYLIDNIPLEDMPNWYDNMVKAGGFDLEWNRNQEITAMGFTTDGIDVIQWSWHPEIERTTLLQHPSSFYFNNEREMLEHFAQYFTELDPDIITTWSGNRADWPMIYKRYKFHDLGLDWLSSIPNRQSGMTPSVKPLPRDGAYQEGTQVILGRLTLDLADRNHGFERVWRDSGNGQLGDRRLGSVGKEAFPNSPELWKIDFENDPDLKGCDNHHDLWMKYFDKFLSYHRGDVILTDKLDREYHVGRFFSALQTVCGVSYKSVFTVSKFARGQLRRRAEYKAPTANYSIQKQGYPGGFVSDPKGGRHQNVAVLDYRAMYAEIQRGGNISPETRRLEAGKDIKELPNGTFWYHGKIGVLPQLQMDLADARNKAKAQMKKHEAGSNEYAGYNALQLAYKRAAASCYGLMGMEGNGEADMTVASTITFMGRSLVERLMDICEEMGYEPLAGHTDSAYIGIGDADGHDIAKDLTKRIQTEYDSDRYVVEFEKLMKNWVAVNDKKNRNFGWCVWPKQQLHCTGFELKKSNAAPVTKRVQELAFISLCRDDGTREDIDGIVFGIINDARAGRIPIEDITMRGRLSKNPDSYGNGNFWGAARKYNQHNKNKFKSGDGVPHIYTTKGIEAYRSDEDVAKLNIDWTTVIAKQIIAPVALIYEAMGWAQPDASGARARSLF